MLLGGASCGREKAEPALAAERDDFGHEVVPGRAQRIISLNPPMIEILFAIGAGPRMVGRTHWDAYPDSARLVPDMGPGLRPNVEAVLAARPDLVVLYASADNRLAADRIRGAGVKTLSLKVDRIADFERAVTLLGQVTGLADRAAVVRDSVMASLSRVRAATRSLRHPTVFWYIWDAPLITIGAGSFMNELVEIAGGRNVYASDPGPSPTVSLEDVIRRNPEVLIAGPEGTAKLKTSSQWRTMVNAPGRRVVTPDTALVGRPAVRLGEAAVQLAKLLHPAVGL